MADNSGIDAFLSEIKRQFEYVQPVKPTEPEEFVPTDEDYGIVKSLKRFEKTNRYKIYYPLSAFHVDSQHLIYDGYLPKEYQTGLALCHGHNHAVTKLAAFPDITNWYTMDKVEYTNPDYCASASDPYDMSYFPSKYFDAVLLVGCPLSRLDENGEKQFYAILNNCHRIIKPDGQLIIDNLPGLFIWFITDTQFDDLINKINEYLNDNDHFKVIKNKYLDNNKDKYFSLILRIMWDEKYLVDIPVKKYLSEYGLNFTKQLLKNYHYEYVKMEHDCLVAKPINN